MDQKLDSKDPVVARIYDKKLRLSDIHGISSAGEELNMNDSLTFLRAFIDNWMRNQVMLHDAEQFQSSDRERIEHLVADYRSSLLRAEYEESLVSRRLDTSVTQQELQNFYDNNKDRYILQQNIIRYQFMHIPSNKEGVNDVEKWWFSSNKEYQELLELWCAAHAYNYQLQTDKWFTPDVLINAIPDGTMRESSMVEGRELSFRAGDDVYFIRILEKKLKSELAPLAYIQDEARKYILLQRRNKTIEIYQDSMYQHALQTNKAEILIH